MEKKRKSAQVIFKLEGNAETYLTYLPGSPSLAKSPYQAPVLTHFGQVKELTFGLSAPTGESGGNALMRP